MNSLFSTDVKYTQDNRSLRVETALGKDVFLLRRLQATESFSQIFTINIDLLSYEGNLRAEDIIGSHVALFIGIDSVLGGKPRHLNGFVKSFACTGLEKRGLYGYKAELVPWFWFLDKRTNCRIFQNQTVQNIIETLFTELGFHDFNFALIDDHQPLEYCVQYQESDFHFISRLLEQEGLFYFFEHQADKHILHIADNAGTFVFMDEKNIEHSSGSRGKFYLDSWQHRFQYCSGAFAQTDYNFENANLSLLTETPTSIKLANNSALERFEFPGNYHESQRGQSLTRIRMQEEEAGYQVVRAGGNIHTIEVGKKFKLISDEAVADDKKTFVISEIIHEAFEGSYLDEDVEGESSSYKNYLVCFPEEVIYRPPQRTGKPRIDGVQTAVVVGKPGDEIYTDKYGRIKLQFHWDRYGEKNETSSCWVRVATLWAGNKWGTLNIPRVGQEVVVTFVNGDPDQPLVIGSVYNSNHMPPVTLPGGKNYAGMKSKTVKGDVGGSNEFSLDDTGDSQQVKLHAKKDYNTTVGNNLSSSTTGNATYNVDGDNSSTIGGNASLNVQGNESASVQGNQDSSVQGNRSFTTAGNKTENTTGNVEAVVGANESRNVSSNQDVSIGSNQSISVGSNQTNTIGANQQTTVSGNQTLSVTGNQDISALAQNVSISTSATTSALSIAMNGQSQIALSVGGTSITIDPAGITLSMGASSVKIDATGVSVLGPLVKLN